MQQQQQQPPAAAARGLLGALCTKEGKQLQGKSFYLDGVKSRSATLLVEAISVLGGKVESFLHKDVSFVVTGNPEEEGLKKSKAGAKGVSGDVCRSGTQRGSKGVSGDVCRSATQRGSKGVSGDVCRSATQRENAHTPPSVASHAHLQRQDTPRPLLCGSRGKALLEKAIRNNGQVTTSVLANARSWGVKILFVDDVLSYLQRLQRESFMTKRKARAEKNSSGSPTARVVKAVSLRSPYLKIEDLSRKYKPVLLQSMTMPTLYYGGRYSPFEPPPPPRPEGKTKDKRKDKARDGRKAARSSQNNAGVSPLARQSRKKDTGYCECCHMAYGNQEQHLLSSEHRAFVLDASNYLEVNQLVAGLHPGFCLHPLQPPAPPSPPSTRLPTSPPPVQVPSPAELEFLTDVEADRTLQALLTQAQDQAPSPHTKPLSSSPAVPQTPNTSHPAPAVQPSHHPSPTPLPDRGERGPESPNSQPPSHSSPATPCLDSRSDGPCSPDARLRSDPPLLTPYSDSLLPPVLSPQVPDDLLEPHRSPYSQPPVLRPHSSYLTEDIAILEICPLTHTQTEIVCQLVPDQSNGEGESVWSNKLTNPTHHSGECAGQAVGRSRPLPRPPTTGTNGGEKRSCSSSPERSPTTKKRRVCSARSQRSRLPGFCSVTVNDDKPEDDVMAVVEADLLIDVPVDQSSDRGAAYSTVEHLYFNTDNLQDLETKHAGQSLPRWLGYISGLRSTPRKPTRAEMLAARVGTPPAPTTSQTLPDLLPALYSRCSSDESHLSVSLSLAPDVAALSPSSSSDSDWDCELLARLDPSARRGSGPGGSGVLDVQELLHRPCVGLKNINYESRLHSALQSPPTPPPSLCGDEMEPVVAFSSRTLMQVVEVQH